MEHVFLISFIAGNIFIGYVLGGFEVNSSMNSKIKSEELIILGNSSYKCKQVNTLEEK